VCCIFGLGVRQLGRGFDCLRLGHRGPGTHHPLSLLGGKLAQQARGASTVLSVHFQVIWSTCNFAASQSKRRYRGLSAAAGAAFGQKCWCSKLHQIFKAAWLGIHGSSPGV
jgi:hypothetical protein